MEGKINWLYVIKCVFIFELFLKKYWIQYVHMLIILWFIYMDNCILIEHVSGKVKNNWHNFIFNI